MLPPVPKLMPPFLHNHFIFVDIVDRPQMPVILVEEYRLKDVIFVWHRGGFRIVVFRPELVLVVGAIEGHFDLGWVFGVRVGVVHGAEAGGGAVRVVAAFGFGEFDHLFLRVGFGFGA